MQSILENIICCLLYFNFTKIKDIRKAMPHEECTKYCKNSPSMHIHFWKYIKMASYSGFVLSLVLFWPILIICLTQHSIGHCLFYFIYWLHFIVVHVLFNKGNFQSWIWLSFVKMKNMECYNWNFCFGRFIYTFPIRKLIWLSII